jgi:endonuclease/exonuclease/phosphatase family metal-dependent hydrolase
MASGVVGPNNGLMTDTPADGSPAPPRPNAGVWRAVILTALALALAVPGAVLTAVRVGPWVLVSPWVQLLSAYPLTAVSTFAAVLAALLIGRRRRVRLMVSAGMVLLLLVQFAMLAPRLLPDGWNPLASRPAGQASAGQAGGIRGAGLTVMALNVGGARLDATAVLDAVRSHGVEVLALPELSPETLQALEDAGINTLLPQRVLDVSPNSTGSGLFSVFPLTRQERVPGSEFFQSRALVEVPGIPRRVRLTAAHVESPRPGQVTGWRKDLQELAELQRSAPAGAPAVLLGDFNSSLDHRGLRRLLSAGLSDAAAATGRGLWPTWPANSSVPAFVQIDHVLASREFAVESFTTVAIPGPDHVGVASRLSFRG